MKNVLTFFLSLFLFHFVEAQEFAKWLFDAGNDNNTATGTLTPTLGTGTLTLIGGVTNTFGAGYPDGTLDNSASYTTNYPAQSTGNGTAGIEVAVNTTGKSNVFVSWWQLHSNTSSRYVQFQYSLNGGASWIIADLTQISTLGTTGIIDIDDNAFLSGTYNAWYRRVLDLSTVIAVNNNANFRFRVVSIFNPFNPGFYQGANLTTYSTAGRWQFDEVVVRENSPLPLSLANFTGSLKNGFAELNWRTFNEINFSHFIIERSNDAIQFKEIGKVFSANYSNGSAYSFQDKSKLQLINYYRLKMVDKDGTLNYSPVIAVNAKLPLNLGVYPNPVISNLLLTHPKAIEGTTLQIISYDGKKFGAWQVQAGAIQTSVDVSKLTKGNYFVIYQNEKERQSVKLMKQ